jgi:hypothetical protein
LQEDESFFERGPQAFNAFHFRPAKTHLDESEALRAGAPAADHSIKKPAQATETKLTPMFPRFCL